MKTDRVTDIIHLQYFELNLWYLVLNVIVYDFGSFVLIVRFISIMWQLIYVSFSGG